MLAYSRVSWWRVSEVVDRIGESAGVLRSDEGQREHGVQRGRSTYPLVGCSGGHCSDFMDDSHAIFVL